MNDLEIIKELEAELGFGLQPVDGVESLTKNSYKINSDGCIYQIDLSGNKLEDIPKNLLMLKKLAVLNISNNDIKNYNPLLSLELLDELYCELPKKIDDKLVNFIKKAERLKVLFFSPTNLGFLKIETAVLPKEALNHRLSLGSYFKINKLVPSMYLMYDIFPPSKMIHLGYRNPKFYYTNYLENQIIEFYEELTSSIDNLRQPKNGLSKSERFKGETDKIRSEKKDEIIKQLLKRYYSDYERINEMPYSIRKILIESFQGLDGVLIDDIAINSETKQISDPSWIFLTGDNGYGKSSLLQAIVITLNGKIDERTILSDQIIAYVEFNQGHEYRINSVGEEEFYGLSPNFHSFQHFAAYGPARLNISKSNSDTEVSKTTVFLIPMEYFLTSKKN